MGLSIEKAPKNTAASNNKKESSKGLRTSDKSSEEYERYASKFCKFVHMEDRLAMFAIIL